MPFLTNRCPQCNKIAEFETEFAIGTSKLIKYKCGHFVQSDLIQAIERTPEQIESLDGKKLFPYQCRGIRFALDSGVRCLIADEMGLGKTVQGYGTLMMNELELCPFLGVVKSALTEQWQREGMRWMGEDAWIQIIKDKQDQFLPGMKGYIISYDMVRRFAEKDKPKRKKKADDLYRPFDTTIDKIDTVLKDSYLVSMIKKHGIKTILLDEVQQIKNTESKRTIYVRELCKEVKHVIALSGTPIKNNALEYFPILNILDPTKYPRFSSFQMNECDTYFDGYKMKAGGLRYPADFMEKTKKFIIRREMKDVKHELPTPQDPITRNFSFHNMGEEVAKMYEDSLKEMLDFMDSAENKKGSFQSEGNILKYLTKMRHITGLAKIDPCIDHCMSFLGSCDRKMVIFTHHLDVAEILQVRLASLMKELDLTEPIRFEAGNDSQQFVARFKDGPRIAIVSTLAGGEGMDGLQEFCSDMIMLERQWNPANEEQAEKRISQRIGQKNHVTGTYFVAVGTVDEFFSEIVERKREIVSKTLSGEAVIWSESSLMRELTETLQSQGLRRWSLK